MALLTWLLVGAAVLLAILVIGLGINRKKATADLAIRLAEAYRSRGQFEAAMPLYEVSLRLGQNREGALEGRELARQGARTPPAIEPGLVEATASLLEDERERLQALLDARGVDVELPALGSASQGSDPPRGGGDEAT